MDFLKNLKRFSLRSKKQIPQYSTKKKSYLSSLLFCHFCVNSLFRVGIFRGKLLTKNEN